MVQELSGGRSGGQGLKVWVLERYNSRTLMDSYTGSLIKLQCNHSMGNLTTGQMPFAQSNQNLPISDQTA